MKKSGDEEAAALVEADRNASLRFKTVVEQRREDRVVERRRMKMEEKNRVMEEKKKTLAEERAKRNTLKIQEVPTDDVLPDKLDAQLTNVMNHNKRTPQRTPPALIPPNKSEREEEQKRRQEAGEATDVESDDDDDDSGGSSGDSGDSSGAGSVGSGGSVGSATGAAIPHHTMDHKWDPSEKYAKALDARYTRVDPSRWRKALKERRALREACDPGQENERIVEAAHAKGVVHAHRLSEAVEIIAENNVYTRRYSHRGGWVVVVVDVVVVVVALTMFLSFFFLYYDCSVTTVLLRLFYHDCSTTTVLPRLFYYDHHDDYNHTTTTTGCTAVPPSMPVCPSRPPRTKGRQTPRVPTRLSCR